MTKQSHSAGGVVVNTEGKVLVVKQQGRGKVKGPDIGISWSLPKGHIESGEDPKDAAKREIYEESGIRDLSLVKSLGTYKRYKIALDGGDDRSELKTIHMFLFRTNQTGLRPIDRHNPEARWIEKDKVVKLLTHKKDQEFFRSVMEQI
jgi:ADP-ribose pyrophosphatase YjhB (NUDIX family)